MKKVLVEHRKNSKGEYTSWQYKFEGASIGGKRKWITKAGFASEEEAYMEGMKALQSYKNGGQVVNPSEMSMTDFLNLWLKEYCENNLKQTTVLNYRKRINNQIIPRIGKYHLNSIRTDAMQHVIDDMFQNNYARNSISTVKGILSKSMKWAKKQHYIEVNHALELEMPLVTAVPKKGETRKHVRQYLEKELIDDLFKRFPEGHPCYIPLIFGYRCGLRLGEAFGVCWEDIDLEEGTLTVKRQIQYDENINELYISSPKYNSTRTMPLDSDTIELLKRTRTQQKKAKLYYGEHWTQQYVSDDHYINESRNGKEIHFVNIRENGTQVKPRCMQHVGRMMKLQLNRPEWDFHSLRHTHCADLFDAGLPMNSVKNFMGHKNIETTLNIYDHMTKHRKTKAKDIIANMYAEK